MTGGDYFRVYGVPAPQGSKRHVGRGILVESSKAVKPWREAVKWAHIAAGRKNYGDSAVSLEVTFWLLKPKSVRRALPSVKPDLDKLMRSTMDALTDSGAWADDAQVVQMNATKLYTADPRETGAKIAISTVSVWSL